MVQSFSIKKICSALQASKPEIVETAGKASGTVLVLGGLVAEAAKISTTRFTLFAVTLGAFVAWKGGKALLNGVRAMARRWRDWRAAAPEQKALFTKQAREDGAAVKHAFGQAFTPYHTLLSTIFTTSGFLFAMDRQYGMAVASVGAFALLLGKIFGDARGAVRRQQAVAALRPEMPRV